MTPRDKILRLVKGRPVDPGPIVAPLAHAVGARIEELSLSEFLTNPTKLAKGLKELGEAIQTDAIVCCCAAAMEAEGAGVEVSWETYPPQVVGHLPADALADECIGRALASPRIAAAIEATQRLAATVRGEPALVAGITGPLTLARQLAGPDFAEAMGAGDERAWRTLDFASRLAVAVAREFLKAGASVLLLQEDDALPAPDCTAFAEWKSAIVPLANVARFHQAMPILVPAAPGNAKRVLDLLPRTLSVCLPPSLWQEHERVAGIAVSADGDWSEVSPAGWFLVTAGEVAPDWNIGLLRQACAKLRQA